MVPFDRLHTISYSSSIVTMAVSRTVFEIKGHNHWLKTSIFSYPLLFNLHDPLELLRFFPKILIQSVRVPGLRWRKNAENPMVCVHQRYRQTTDGRLMP